MFEQESWGSDLNIGQKITIQTQMLAFLDALDSLHVIEASNEKYRQNQTWERNGQLLCMIDKLLFCWKWKEGWEREGAAVWDRES